MLGFDDMPSKIKCLQLHVMAIALSRMIVEVTGARASRIKDIRYKT